MWRRVHLTGAWGGCCGARSAEAAERQRVLRYLERRKYARAGYRGALWALLNSSEFAVNH